jgi:hypothetical protein
LDPHHLLWAYGGHVHPHGRPNCLATPLRLVRRRVAAVGGTPFGFVYLRDWDDWVVWCFAA